MKKGSYTEFETKEQYDTLVKLARQAGFKMSPEQRERDWKTERCFQVTDTGVFFTTSKRREAGGRYVPLDEILGTIYLNELTKGEALKEVEEYYKPKPKFKEYDLVEDDEGTIVLVYGEGTIEKSFCGIVIRSMMYLDGTIKTQWRNCSFKLKHRYGAEDAEVQRLKDEEWQKNARKGLGFH